MRKITAVFYLTWVLCGLVACKQGQVMNAVAEPKKIALTSQRLVISIAQQMMVTFEGSKPRRMFRVSTSRFGTGDKRGTYFTPLGRLQIMEIVGKGLPVGAKLKAREPTGEIVPVNAPGRDPIVTRVLRLQGLEPRNANALERGIYIHGTPVETKLMTPASYGCVRMASADVIALADWVKVGTLVDILPGKLPAPEQLPPEKVVPEKLVPEKVPTKKIPTKKVPEKWVARELNAETGKGPKRKV